MGLLYGSALWVHVIGALYRYTFSDGSEKTARGIKSVGYGYAVYQNGQQIAMGHGSINTLSHVFDAEVIGAWKGLHHMIGLPLDISQCCIWLCIDSTSVIWCL